MQKIIDLTHSLEEGMISFPSHWHVPFEINILGRHSIEKRETRKVLFSTHTGTHIDAPSHFIPNGNSLDDIELSNLVGKARLIDVSFLNQGECLTLVKLKELLPDILDVKKVVFKFGWSQYWNTDKFYNNWPYFEKEAIKYLIQQGIHYLGMDTPSPDNANHDLKSGNDSPNHKILLAKNVVINEYLTNLNLIENDIFELYCLPLKLKNSDGAPVRCIAIV